MTYGFSRDDSSKFIHEYQDKNLLASNQFKILDLDGVGALVEMASSKGKTANPALKRGVCGEHGGDPKSIIFIDKIGLEYTSCSPFRVPVAIVAETQAAIINSK